MAEKDNIKQQIEKQKNVENRRGDDEIEEVVDQDPGHRQKENQNDQKDDPLAA